MWKQALILGIGLSVLAGPALADRRDHRHDRHDRYDRHDRHDRHDRYDRHGRYHKNRWAKSHGNRGYSWWAPRWGHYNYHPGHHRCR
jgi:hypothetical protein